MRDCFSFYGLLENINLDTKIIYHIIIKFLVQSIKKTVFNLQRMCILVTSYEEEKVWEVSNKRAQFQGWRTYARSW